MDYSVDELICVCISRQVEDGEIVAQGLATPLVAAGYLLARPWPALPGGGGRQPTTEPLESKFTRPPRASGYSQRSKL